jgi:hypothetical protein
MWKHPQILGTLTKWGTGVRHIYNIKNIKYKILKIKTIMTISTVEISAAARAILWEDGIRP